MNNDALQHKQLVKIQNLARSFPTLRGAPGTDPWDAIRLDEWAHGVGSSGQRYAAQFVLAVWNPCAERKVGRFDVFDAISSWDIDHREAFLAWARDPF